VSLLCRLGLHYWWPRGGETIRDGHGKIRIQYEVCRRGCSAMRMRNRSQA